MASIIRTDALQNLNTSNIISQTNATTLTIGASGQTISIPAGATLTNSGTASGFGLTWQSVQTTGFTAVKGNAYPCNTTSTAFTVTLPATPSAGDQIQLVDYAGTFDTNKLTINPNGNKIEGSTDSVLLSGEREGVTLTYIDSTQGWLASSGINEGTDALSPTTYSADILLIGDGGGGGSAGYYGGGGGAGGFRSFSSQLLTIGSVYTVTIGTGGSGSTPNAGDSGTGSSISGTGISYTSAGGGGGGGAGSSAGKNGGSGGGGFDPGAPGNGNTPSTSPSQGNNGGAQGGTMGGGGAGAVGGTNSNVSPPYGAGGGNGTASSITGSSVTYAGGGGSGGRPGAPTGGTGGGGNGGTYAPNSLPTNGTANTGGGGGGIGYDGSDGGNGGSGVCIISVPTSSYSSTTTGSPTVTTSGSNTIIKFTGSGSYTA
jgi:hypothetical protein